MKKKQDSPISREDRIEGVRIVLDDARYILDSMEETFESIQISDDAYHYDSLEELVSKRGARPVRVEISAKHDGSSQGHIHFTITGLTAVFSGYDIGDDLALWMKLTDYARSTVPQRYRTLNPTFWGFIAFLKLLLDLVVLNSGATLINPAWIHFLLLASLAVLGVAFVDRRLSYGAILRPRHEVGFLQRNSDQIVLLVIGAFLGMVGTLIIQFIASR